MKNFSWNRFYIFAGFFFLCVWCYGAPANTTKSGGWVSNGTDWVEEQDNIWFLGPKPISICLESTPGYPLPIATQKTLIEKAFASWKRFFEKYKLAKAKIPASAFHDNRPRSLTLEYKWSSACDLNDPEQLKVLFGVSNNEIKEIKKSRGVESAAFAARRPYNHRTYRNGGYIWVTDKFHFGQNHSWVQSYVEHLLLHELGHVFGMAHDAVFVMDKDTAVNRMLSAVLNNKNLGKVESSIWPFSYTQGTKVQFCKDQHILFDPKENYCQASMVPASWRDVFGLPDRVWYDAFLEWQPEHSYDFWKTPNRRYHLNRKKLVFLLRLINRKSGFEKQWTLFVEQNLQSPQLTSFIPGIYTSLRNPDGSIYKGRAPLEHKSWPLRFKGHIHLGDRKAGVILDFKGGARLSLFDSQSGSWWELVTNHRSEL